MTYSLETDKQKLKVFFSSQREREVGHEDNEKLRPTMQHPALEYTESHETAL